MVKVEFTFTSGVEVYSFPTKWDDITLPKYRDIVLLPENNIADISIYYCGYSTVKTNLLLSFMQTSFVPAVPDGFSLNIGKESWGKLESARIEIGKIDDEKPDFLALYIRLIEIYTNFAIDELSCIEGVGIGKYIFDSLSKFFEQFKELVEEEDDIAELAGKGELDALGFLVSLDELAHGDILKYDEILKQPALNVYRKFLLDKRKSKFQKNYQIVYKQLHDAPSTS